MERILEYLKDPSWWFTVVFTGILASLSASYLRDYISLILSKYSARSRQKRRRRLKVMARQVRALKRNIRLLVIDAARFLFTSFFFLAYALYYISLQPTHVTRFVTVTFAILGMLIFISTKNGFTRASYEIRRYHKVDGKSIKKLIHSPEKVQK
jgi:hypothetical protein